MKCASLSMARFSGTISLSIALAAFGGPWGAASHYLRARVAATASARFPRG
jgi:hypothetical protein